MVLNWKINNKLRGSNYATDVSAELGVIVFPFLFLSRFNFNCSLLFAFTHFKPPTSNQHLQNVLPFHLASLSLLSCACSRLDCRDLHFLFHSHTKTLALSPFRRDVAYKIKVRIFCLFLQLSIFCLSVCSHL